MSNEPSGSETSSEGIITPRAPFVGSHWTENLNPSTSSEGRAVPSFDFCCKRATTRCLDERAGPGPDWGGPWASRIDIVNVPPRVGIGVLGLFRPVIVGRLEKKRMRAIYNQRKKNLTSNMMPLSSSYLVTFEHSNNLPIPTISCAQPAGKDVSTSDSKSRLGSYLIP